MTTAQDIVQFANYAGFDKCGIIPIEMMSGYEQKLEERMQHFPQTKQNLNKFRAFSHLKENYNWAKSIVVCSYWYGKYDIDEIFQNRIAKYYLTDGRKDEYSPGYQTSLKFEKYLINCGFRVATERHFGITALRWAAMQAGMGIIRKNNFFYTEKGSYQYLEAFLIDANLEYIVKHSVRPCSEKCNICVKNCPTASLESAYCMCRNTCVSCLTTWEGWDLTKEPLREKLGTWVYGCDVCQDVCPYNKNAWQPEQQFPGLKELSKHLSNTEIVLANYHWLETVLQPKLWYVPKGKTWKYKINALNAMLNEYKEEYFAVINQACQDEKKEVRDMAIWVLEQIKKK